MRNSHTKTEPTVKKCMHKAVYAFTRTLEHLQQKASAAGHVILLSLESTARFTQCERRHHRTVSGLGPRSTHPQCSQPPPSHTESYITVMAVGGKAPGQWHAGLANECMPLSGVTCAQEADSVSRQKLHQRWEGLLIKRDQPGRAHMWPHSCVYG